MAPEKLVAELMQAKLTFTVALRGPAAVSHKSGKQIQHINERVLVFEEGRLSGLLLKTPRGFHESFAGIMKDVGEDEESREGSREIPVDKQKVLLHWDVATILLPEKASSEARLRLMWVASQTPAALLKEYFPDAEPMGPFARSKKIGNRVFLKELREMKRIEVEQEN